MKVILVLLVTCKLCWTIRVPVSWDEGDSEVPNKQEINNEEVFSVESFKPQDVSEEAFKPQGESIRPANSKPIPVEYFEYTAKKPQFAINVAAFHGAQSPENHYKAYPIKPYTRRAKPELGRHHILDSGNTLYKPFQDYTKVNEDQSHATPASSSYEVFHPYELETPALQEIYNDPILTKIKNDLENSKNRLQQYEKDAGEADITKDEYLESPQKTDDKLFPHRDRPAPFEIHRPLRRPVYYRPAPVHKSREQYLNHKLRHPWNHNIAKVRPMHYRPIQKHIHHLRQHHALKYDDERNEYPQVQILENYSDSKDGYDIYEKGKDKFVQLRNNVDESINKAVKENRPAMYEKLEVLNNDSTSYDDEDDEEEFVPIKNYAQVRKTETFRHLPKAAALEDAENYDEIKNAPRLREAVKSTKAQTVYSEEGYEDAAYDHAGEQKHASENEGHGGLLKEHELSGGKYKTPSISVNYEDGKGSVYRDQLIHAQKWKDDNEDTEQQTDEEDYSENEHEHLLEADNHQTEILDEDNQRNKREHNITNQTFANRSHMQSYNSTDVDHEVDKREANFEIPQLDLNETFFTDKEFLKIAKLKEVPQKDTIKQKYPYYFNNLKAISRNSPLRYAENLKLIPKKSKGGSEFYDSRSNFECPEVDDVPDPIPDKLKGDEHPDTSEGSNEDDTSTKGDENFDTAKKQPRLKGLGDQIDCFKSKYFGENPLDSPFFKEVSISIPEPVFLPTIAAYNLKMPILIKQKADNEAEPMTHNVFEQLHLKSTSDLYDLIKKLRSDKKELNPVLKFEDLILSTDKASNHSHDNNTQLEEQSNVYTDVIKNIKNNLVPQSHPNNINKTLNIFKKGLPADNVPYTYFQNKDDVTKTLFSRKKRASPFLYEPYKIIRDGQVQDDIKKTSSLGNISPLVRQLQSRVLDKGNKLSPEESQLVKRKPREYKDIGQKDREIKYGSSKNEKTIEDSEIVDVSVDQRRGEPRYEIKHFNHKSRYTPVSNLKTMTKEDYESQISGVKVTKNKFKGETSTGRPNKQKRPTENPYFDISEFIPHTTEVHYVAASNTVRKTVSTTTPLPVVTTNHKKGHQQDEDSGSEEDYEEYDDEEEEEEEEDKITTTSTTTTPKPAFRRKIRLQAATQEPLGLVEEPKLKLVTRFRDYKPKDHTNKHLRQLTEDHTEKSAKKINRNHDEVITPNYREKKKKVTKSTLVTDTKKYGDDADDEDETMKDVVDALIGIKHNIDDYVPQYEKNQEKKPSSVASNDDSGHDNKHSVDDERIIDNEDDEEDYETDDTIEDEDDDDEDDDEEDENDDNKSIADKEDTNPEEKHTFTTPEPTKRTLIITTDAPIPTTATRNAKIQAKPFITRKKIEIHKELPVNKSSPHISQFKQDIKEIEIIKESRNPLKRKSSKNVEVLDLYKDDSLAKDINKLGVEIFKENLDLRQGPKHGGNYRSAETKSMMTHEIPKKSKDDAETSQSENTKHVKTSYSDNPTPLRTQKLTNRARNSKLIELSETTDTTIHGGNFRQRGRSRKNGSNKQKIIELDEEYDDDNSNDSHEGISYKNSRNGQPIMHGGNYRSAKLTDEKQPETSVLQKTLPTDARRNAALVLNSFVQAAPVLTTTPGYILDPSKRKYYYLDA